MHSDPYCETAEIRSDPGYPGGTYVNLQAAAGTYTINTPVAAAIAICDANNDGKVDFAGVIASLQITTKTTNLTH
ncbi:MAG: hypothetical protein JRI86_05840 [Deltaproteobacteria bacterium]|nr:hypothetical protein [Deltaproteobacteria bacterium]